MPIDLVKLKARKKRHYEKHKAELQEKARQYRRDNAEKVNKADRKRYTGERKQRIAELGKAKREIDPEATRQRKREYYYANRDRILELRRIAYDQFLVKVGEYINGWYCRVCGLEDDPCVYDLHHIDPATKKFGLGGAAGKKWDVVTAEIDKCICLCAPCHRKLERGIIGLTPIV